ncbi:MAG TPA: DNA repair protein RecO [Desulfoprunum sp.]|nr:DNA repair protein RecO [Desulfoprunum sp.]
MPARSYEVEAIVLATRDHGEADLIVTFFSLERGRATGIAKGAKRSKRRFVNKLEIFSFLHLTCSDPAGGGLVFIHEADLHTPFLRLRTDPPRYATASVVREFLLLALREGERDETIFRLALWALHGLDAGRPRLSLLLLYLLRFYSAIGYRPVLEACLTCGIAVSPSRSFAFSHLGGGLVCATCAASGHPGTRLSPGSIRLMQSALELPLDKLHRLKLTNAMRTECLTALHLYGRHLFQRDIHSWAMLDSFGNRDGMTAGPLQM